jgi:hypothetical protein
VKNARVVDQNVDPAFGFEDVADGSSYRVVISYVESSNGDVEAVLVRGLH